MQLAYKYNNIYMNYAQRMDKMGIIWWIVLNTIEMTWMKIDIEWYFYMDEVGSMEDINYVDVIGQVGAV